MKKIVTFLTKNAKNPHPCPHSATMNSEFMAAVGGWGAGGIYRRRPKAPVGPLMVKCEVGDRSRPPKTKAPHIFRVSSYSF